jgi:hypothetical protein
VRIGNYLYSSFSIENGLKHGDAVSPYFAVECVIRRVFESNLRMDINCTHQILAYVDDIRIIERNADVLLNSCKNIRLSVNIGKNKYLEVGSH